MRLIFLALTLFFSTGIYASANIQFTIVNNTSFMILAQPSNMPGMPGSCSFTVPSTLVCNTDDEGKINSTVSFTLDSAQGVMPNLMIEVPKIVDSNIYFDRDVIPRFSLSAHVSPSMWDGKTNVMGTITFSCINGTFCSTISPPDVEF